MIEVTSDDRKTRGMSLIGAQPIALAAGALVLLVVCVAPGLAGRVKAGLAAGMAP